MCILIVKPKGKICPSKETLEECFDRNPDGAGFSYNKNGVIVLRKGFMTFEDFYEATKKIPTESTALIHCRIGTSGGNTQGLTHPYPLCNDYKKMQKITQILKPTDNKKAYAVAHNGIFSELETRKDVNDTCVFIANILNPLNDIADDILDEKLDSVISRCTDTSKIAILDNEGNCKMYGSGWIEDCGIYYSNSTYKPFSYNYNWRGNYDYGYYGYDDDEVIYDKDCFYKYNSSTDSYDQKGYDSKFISDKIKKYGSWKNYINSIADKEEKEIEELKKKYPLFKEDIDYYISQGLTAFQIKQWIGEVFDDYIDDSNEVTDKDEDNLPFDKEEDYYEDEDGLYKMEIANDTNEIVLKKVSTKKDEDKLV